MRDLPAKNITTHLSHYLKFGVISTREAFSLFKQTEVLKRQLIWRDFYYTYYAFNKESFEGDINLKNIWQNNTKFIIAWKNGKTGFPIVDAGMRQLKNENFMHNRVRMIVANFLSKILLVDWRIGEKHFSKNLIDIDRIQNMAGWHSVTSVAKHGLAYFRIFNPWLQSQKYDKDCEYIKKYVPELNDLEPKIIHNLSKYDEIHVKNYPKPIVNYEEQKKKYLKLMKA
jgi:deoxyribodipyrimidine photo-lyase